MEAKKLEHDLLDLRISLYHQFDDSDSPLKTFMLQRTLAELLLKAENGLKNKQLRESWLYHQERLLALGDALVWRYLEQFTIRQLGQYESVKTSLSGQQGNFIDLIDSYKNKAENDIYLFADLCRCITIGDVIRVDSPDQVDIQEIKGENTKIKTASELLAGRNGRQYSKILWLKKFLETGFEKLYKQEKPTKIFYSSIKFKYYFDQIEGLLKKHNSVDLNFIQPEPGLIYYTHSFFDDLERDKVASLKQVFLNAKFKRPALASSSRLIENDNETTYHFTPLNFQISLEHRILLQEVDITIMGVIDIAYLAEKAERKGYLLRLNDDEFIELEKEGFSLKYHPRFLNDILINFLEIDSMLDTIISLHEQLSNPLELSAEEVAHLEKRPKNHKEMIQFLEQNYVSVLFKNDGIIEAYKLDGSLIDIDAIISQIENKKGSV